MNDWKRFKNRKLHNRCVFILLLLLTGVHILSWNSKAFTNWYRLHIFPFWTGTLGRISDLFHGSVGEVLIGIGIGLLVLEVLFLGVSIAGFLCRRCRKKANIQKAADGKQEQGQNKKLGNEQNGKQDCKQNEERNCKQNEERDCKQNGKQGYELDKNQDDKRKQDRRKKIRVWNFRLLVWIFVYIYGTETLNCYILYHASTVEEQYFDHEAEYGTDELIAAYTEVVTKANALSSQMVRDEHGQAVFGGTDAQLYEACRKAMKAQGSKYPYLAGYYPNPKPIRVSHFMSQQYLLGIYFPFTMEANYNTVMYPVNMPVTICHEYSHLKGIIMEDEANYFGFIACIESDEPYLQYSGYLSVIGYLARQVRNSVPEEIRSDLVNANEQVQKDDVFLTEDQWARVEEKAVVPTETVNKATNAFLEKNLTLNGIEDGIASYSRVVRLVIRYFSEGDGTNR